MKYYVIFIKTECRCWRMYGRKVYTSFEKAEEVIKRYGEGHGGHYRIPNSNQFISFEDSFEIVEVTMDVG